MKKRILLFVALLAATFSVLGITILWYHQAPHAVPLGGNDLFLVERLAPHTNLYASIDELALYATNGLASTAALNSASNSILNQFTNTINSTSNSILAQMTNTINVTSNSILNQFTNTINTTSNSILNTVTNMFSSITNTVFPQMVFVATNGNDATATRGRLDLPAATFARGRELAKSGDTVFIFNGLYGPITTNGNLVSNITVIGESAEGVTLRSDIGGQTMTILGQATVENLTLDTLANNYPLWIYLTTPVTNITVRNVILRGNHDCVMSQSSGAPNICTNVLFDNCILETAFDSLNLQAGGIFTFKNTVFRATYNGIAASHVLCNARISTAISSFINCDFYVNTSDALSSTTENFNISGTANVRISNCGMYVNAPAGTVKNIEISAGSVWLDGVSVSTNGIAQSGGTVSFAPGTFVGQFVGDGRGLTNIPFSSLNTSNTLLVNQIDYYTNLATMHPDFALGYAAITTNASFTFLSPINTDPTKTKVQTAVMRVDNSTGPTPILATMPANVNLVPGSVVWITNSTWFTFSYYAPDQTNCYAVPIR